MAPAGVYTHIRTVTVHSHALSLSLLVCSGRTGFSLSPDLKWKAFVHASHAQQTVHLAPPVVLQMKIVCTCESRDFLVIYLVYPRSSCLRRHSKIQTGNHQTCLLGPSRPLFKCESLQNTGTNGCQDTSLFVCNVRWLLVSFLCMINVCHPLCHYEGLKQGRHHHRLPNWTTGT